MKEQEKYKVYVSSLLNPSGTSGEELRNLYEEIARALEGTGKLIEVKNTSDIWMRDYMPIQIDENTFVTYQYSPDYLWSPERRKYITSRFSTPAKIRANEEKEPLLPFYRPGVELRECRLILDGGNVVVCGDKIILTDKVFIENRPKSKDQIVGELRRAFGKEVIIIPSDPYEIEEARNIDSQKPCELPLCHADGVLAPIDDESILIADYSDDPLGYVPQLMNMLSQYFKPENIKHFDFGELWKEDTWVYINFLRLGDLVLMPELPGEEALNNMAENQLKKYLGINDVKRIDTSFISFGKKRTPKDSNHTAPDTPTLPTEKTDTTDNYGGALHCITWEVKA